VPDLPAETHKHFEVKWVLKLPSLIENWNVSTKFHSILQYNIFKISLVSGFYVRAERLMTERIYWAWHSVEMRWRLKGAYSRQRSQWNRYTLSGIVPKRVYIYIYIYMCVCVCIRVYIYIYCIYALRVSCWVSSVGMVYRLQAERLRNRVSISGRKVNFPLVQEVQNSSGSHPSPIQFVPTIFFFRVYSGRGVNRAAAFIWCLN
jgi:hypothetical protein